MGRAPCCDKANVKKGPWSPEEDAKLKEYIEKHGTGGNWIALPQKAGLRRCGKSCRLRWLNYLRPNIRHGEFSEDEDRIIFSLFASIGSRWSIIAAQLPGRTDNDIKNYWNTKLKKKLMGIGMVPSSQKRPHQATTYPVCSSFSAAAAYKCCNNTNYHTTTQTSSLTGYEPISMPSNTTILQAQEGYVGQVHQYQVKDSVLMFGGEASCSSSDGSCSNQISHGREILEHDYGVCNGDLQSYLYDGVDENQKFLLSNGCPEKPNGLYGETTPVDYSCLEEIKQLISTNSSNNLNFFVDHEIKTEEKMVYY